MTPWAECHDHDRLLAAQAQVRACWAVVLSSWVWRIGLESQGDDQILPVTETWWRTWLKRRLCFMSVAWT